MIIVRTDSLWIPGALIPPERDDYWWNEIPEEHRRELLQPVKQSKCAFCGGLVTHSVLCKELQDTWHVMPWGKYKKKHIRTVSTDYLEFVLKKRYGTSDHREMFLRELRDRDSKYLAVIWDSYVAKDYEDEA